MHTAGVSMAHARCTRLFRLRCVSEQLHTHLVHKSAISYSSFSLRYQPAPPARAASIRRWASTSSSGANENPKRPSEQPPEENKPSLTANIEAAARQRLDDVESAIMHTLNLRDKSRFRKWMLLLAGSAATVWMLQEPIKNYFTEQTADVASRSLDQEAIRQKTRTFIDSILSDPATTARASLFVQTLMHDPQTQASLRQLAVALLQDPELKAVLQAQVDAVVRDALQNPQNKQRLIELFSTTLRDPSTSQAAAVSLQRLATDSGVRNTLVSMARETIREPTVRLEASDVARRSAMDVLTDAAVQQRVEQFLLDILADGELQRQGGVALRSAVRYSLTPKWMSQHHSRSASDDSVLPSSTKRESSPPLSSGDHHGAPHAAPTSTHHHSSSPSGLSLPLPVSSSSSVPTAPPPRDRVPATQAQSHQPHPSGPPASAGVPKHPPQSSGATQSSSASPPATPAASS